MLLKSLCFQLVPDPLVKVYGPSNQTVSHSLTLECSVTTVRGITSRVDIVWSNNGVEIAKTIGASINSSTNNSVIYKDFYSISQLNTTEDGEVYQCEGIINTIPNLTSESSITLDLIGRYSTAYTVISLWKVKFTYLNLSTTINITVP